MRSRSFKTVAHSIGSLVDLDASHGCLQPGIVALDRVQKIADSNVLVRELVGDMLRSSLHGHKGISMLSNEPIEGEAALAFPLSSVEELLVTLDFSFPLVIASVLV